MVFVVSSDSLVAARGPQSTGETGETRAYAAQKPDKSGENSSTYAATTHASGDENRPRPAENFARSAENSAPTPPRNGMVHGRAIMALQPLRPDQRFKRGSESDNDNSSRIPKKSRAMMDERLQAHAKPPAHPEKGATVLTSQQKDKFAKRGKLEQHKEDAHQARLRSAEELSDIQKQVQNHFGSSEQRRSGTLNGEITLSLKCLRTNRRSTEHDTEQPFLLS